MLCQEKQFSQDFNVFWFCIIMKWIVIVSFPRKKKKKNKERRPDTTAWRIWNDLIHVSEYSRAWTSKSRTAVMMHRDDEIVPGFFKHGRAKSFSWYSGHCFGAQLWITWQGSPALHFLTIFTSTCLFHDLLVGLGHCFLHNLTAKRGCTTDWEAVLLPPLSIFMYGLSIRGQPMLCGWRGAQAVGQGLWWCIPSGEVRSGRQGKGWFGQ